MNYKEASEALGVTPRTIYRWIDSGKLEAIKDHDDEWRISRASVENVLKKEASKLEGNAKSFSILRVETEFKNYVNEQVSRELDVIKGFSSHLVGSSDEQSAVEAVKKINKRYENIRELQAGLKTFNKFRQQNKIILEKDD